MVQKMEKKYKMPKKLEKAWVAYLIDSAVGPTLTMIGMRYHDKAEKLNQILITATNHMYKDQRTNFLNDPDGFVLAARMMVVELTDNFIAAQLKDHLLNGMPERKIVIPGPFKPNIIN